MTEPTTSPSDEGVQRVEECLKMLAGLTRGLDVGMVRADRDGYVILSTQDVIRTATAVADEVVLRLRAGSVFVALYDEADEPADVVGVWTSREAAEMYLATDDPNWGDTYRVIELQVHHS